MEDDMHTSRTWSAETHKFAIRHAVGAALVTIAFASPARSQPAPQLPPYAKTADLSGPRFGHTRDTALGHQPAASQVTGDKRRTNGQICPHQQLVRILATRRRVFDHDFVVNASCSDGSQSRRRSDCRDAPPDARGTGPDRAS